MRILVCGGAGYIGSHTIIRLKKSGHRVVVFDNLSKGHLTAIGDTPFIKGDITCKADLDKVFAEYNVDAVMHFAANCLVGESMQQPGIYYRNNVTGTLNILEAMRDAGVNLIVFSSTAAVYGNPIELPIVEGHPKAPTNPYGATKLAVEDMLRWFGVANGIKHISLRYFNAAGADNNSSIGEDHNPETHLIPLVLQTALGLLPEVCIFGTEYPNPDGTCIRDYIHVSDLAEAHLLALERLACGGESTVYNLGIEKGFSVREVIRTAEEVTGRTVKFSVGLRRPGDPAILVASAEKTRRDLGWSPRYNDLKSIISTAWDWHIKHPYGYLEK